MKPSYDPELQAEIRQRMSPPSRESVAEIARSTGINVHTLYSWRHRWKQEGQLVPATNKAPEQWSASDKLAAVIQAAGLSGTDLGAFCRERGLYPKQMPMAIALPAWLTSENSSGRIKNKHARYGG